MSHHFSGRRLPRAHIDPIADEATALTVVRAALAVPRRHETIVVMLDDAHRGRTIVSVDGTDEPDQVLEVVECFTRPELVESGLGAIIIASDRTAAGGLTIDDGDRWFEMCDVADRVGVEVVEWFVLGATVSCPRDLVGSPPRWCGPGARSA